MPYRTRLYSKKNLVSPSGSCDEGSKHKFQGWDQVHPWNLFGLTFIFFDLLRNSAGSCRSSLRFYHADRAFRAFRFASQTADAVVFLAFVESKLFATLRANFQHLYRTDIDAIAASLAFFQINLNGVHDISPLFECCYF
jgi:hypothetical protein